MTRARFGLSGHDRDELIRRFLRRRQDGAADGADGVPDRARADVAAVPEAFTRFDRMPGYERVLASKVAARRIGVDNPYFRVHEGCASATTVIQGRTYINFSSYNYLGLSGHPRVNGAARAAIDRYGTSPSASRLVAGERPVQRELEEALASLYGVDDCLTFVSGHATNVTTIGSLFGPKDLVIHDALIHNSVIEGIRLSGAARRSFAHNDPAALETILAEIRADFERVLVVIEGLYGMDGDVPDLPRFVDVKRRYKAFLMVDEAHALGVLGGTGRGVHEHLGVAGRDVDIWMGTLSKALAGCGGYIAGETALVEQLRYGAPGFVYSVGLPPAMAAASLEALRIMLAEPERVGRLRERAQAFARGLEAVIGAKGLAQGYAIVPQIAGSSLKAVRWSLALHQRGISVQPILHPAVEEQAARLRWFMSCLHSEEQIELALREVAAVCR